MIISSVKNTALLNGKRSVFNRKQQSETAGVPTELPSFADAKSFVHISFMGKTYDCLLTPFITALINHDNKKALDIAKSSSFDVNAADKCGHTALMYACEWGSTDAIKALLEHKGIDVNAADEYGGTALMYACNSASTDAVKALLECDGIDVNAADEEGHTALMDACECGSTGAVKALLEHKGIDVNAADNGGNTALMYACASGSTGAVKALLECDGIDVNVTNCSGTSAIQFACNAEKVNMDIIKLLCQYSNNS